MAALFAISDLHVGYAQNRKAFSRLSQHPDDWLILGGDLGETEDHLRFVLDIAAPRFKQLVWVPGNHELYVLQSAPGPRGEDKYRALIEVCQSYGVLTPEDPYRVFPDNGGGEPHLIAPLFLLYDYSFRPSEVPAREAVGWAMESGILCSDEHLLDPQPHSSIRGWCYSRLSDAEERLAAAPDLPKVLINHYPLREELVRLDNIPRFSIWCGTKRTHDWHTRYGARVVVYGHLHMPSTDWIDGVRFEEVSFGYPRQRPSGRTIDDCLRRILPG